MSSENCPWEISTTILSLAVDQQFELYCDKLDSREYPPRCFPFQSLSWWNFSNLILKICFYSRPERRQLLKGNSQIQRRKHRFEYLWTTFTYICALSPVTKEFNSAALIWPMNGVIFTPQFLEHWSIVGSESGCGSWLELGKLARRLSEIPSSCMVDLNFELLQLLHHMS